MTTKYKISIIVSLALLATFGTNAPARASEVDELKATVQAMQKSMEQMQARIAELERENNKHKQQAAAFQSCAVRSSASRGANAQFRFSAR